jgi:hypothetical protein
MFAFNTLMIALEQPWESSKILFECKMAAAAQWMEISAARIYDGFRAGSVVANLSPRDITGLGNSRSPFNGPNVLSMDRWELWMNKLQNFADRKDMSDDARSHARLAAQAMEEAASEESTLDVSP